MPRYEFELFAGINSDVIQSPRAKALQARRTKMPSKTTTTLAALLFFGSASAALANTNNRNDHQGSVVGGAVSVTMSSGGAGAVNYEQKPSTAEEKAGFGTPQLALAERARSVVLARTQRWLGSN
jgi:hypothetical protein